jgi:hypothetical protein
MSDSYAPRPDPIDDLLAPPTAAVDDVFRQEVLARTTKVLRGRRRLSQLARLAGLAACFVAGLVTSHGLRPTEPSAPSPVVARSAPPAVDATSALALEWEAIDHPDRAGALYRAAGDNYLAEDADPQAAVRCYGNALSAGSPQDLTIDPSDSWLLMAIKDARQKETRDANRLQ